MIVPSDRAGSSAAERFARFITWDATPDLAQATWEWPEPWQPVDEVGCSIALINDLKALEAYEVR